MDNRQISHLSDLPDYSKLFCPPLERAGLGIDNTVLILDINKVLILDWKVRNLKLLNCAGNNQHLLVSTVLYLYKLYKTPNDIIVTIFVLMYTFALFLLLDWINFSTGTCRKRNVEMFLQRL